MPNAVPSAFAGDRDGRKIPSRLLINAPAVFGAALINYANSLRGPVGSRELISTSALLALMIHHRDQASRQTHRAITCPNISRQAGLLITIAPPHN